MRRLHCQVLPGKLAEYMDDVKGWCVCVCVFHSLLKVVEGLTVWGHYLLEWGLRGERTRVTCLVNTSSTTKLHICLSPIIYIY